MRQIVRRRGESTPEIVEAPEPNGPLVVRTLATGIDGTDEAVLLDPATKFPAGRNSMVLGHEATGIVERGEGTVETGAQVVPMVRLGCSRCPACLAGRADQCMTGDYIEAGIKARDGFMQDRWSPPVDSLVVTPEGLGWKAVLAEPLSISVKALEAGRQIGGRSPWIPDDTLVCGSGSLASLALLHLRSNDAECTALDRHEESAASSRLLKRIGAKHLDSRQDNAASKGQFGLILETTGVASVLETALDMLAPNGVVALLGVPMGEGEPYRIQPLTRQLVLRNQTIVGSVNSSKDHVSKALTSLARIEARFSGVLDDITQTFEPADVEQAYAAGGHEVIKKVILWKDA